MRKLPLKPNLIFKIHFDSTLARLDNFGNPYTIPPGNSAQSPQFHNMSAHYMELAQDSFTQIGNGYIAYKGSETTDGGSNAIDLTKPSLPQWRGRLLKTFVSGFRRNLQMAASFFNLSEL